MATYQAGVPDEASVLVQKITANIHKITLLTSDVQKVVSQLGPAEGSSQLLQTLQQKQQQGNQLARETDRLMKTFSSLPVTTEQRQRKLQKERLLNDFSSALNSFQKTQRQVADRERELVARVRAGSRVSGGQSEDGYGNTASFQSGSQLQAEEDTVTEEDLRLIQERETAIKQLESDITDINDIFKDLGMMVHEQGDIIDSIEANVGDTEVNIQNANQQLQHAAEHQRSSRKKIFILIVVLAVAVVIIALIIWGAVKG